MVEKDRENDRDTASKKDSRTDSRGKGIVVLALGLIYRLSFSLVGIFACFELRTLRVHAERTNTR
jgi:hypothetical protein